MNKTIYDLAKKEKSYYESTPIRVFDNFEWNMYDHIKKTVYYKNSRYTKGNNDQKPFKNIIRPILNVQHRAEGFDVKDIELFVDDEEEYYKSFLARKFHDKWAYENSIDTFIDKLVENFIDFGGVLVKKTKNGPETVPWQRIAFVDQTNIMSGPIAEAHFYNPDELRREAEKRGWDTDAVDMAIWHAEKEKKTSQSDKNETPGRY
ncbi:MAG TPA: hypothetical protein VKO61_01220, partial [Candidatus Paceibacterota bacterium]|nr:hypothetical protein [Candidatus Paceibacterota bacterium]